MESSSKSTHPKMRTHDFGWSTAFLLLLVPCACPSLVVALGLTCALLMAIGLADDDDEEHPSNAGALDR